MMRVLDYEFPDSLYYSKEHEWVRLEGKEAVVGITDYAQEQLHEIVYVEVQKEGSEVKQFQTMGTVESVKSVSDIFSPVTGKITKVNKELSDSPELLNEDPYGKGWLLIITPSNLNAELTTLMDFNKSVEWHKSLIAKG